MILRHYTKEELEILVNLDKKYSNKYNRFFCKCGFKCRFEANFKQHKRGCLCF